MTPPDRVVFDAEPIVAHADDEPGSEAVETYLTAVQNGDTEGLVSYVTLTEVRYVLARMHDRGTADQYLDWLQTLGVTPVDVGEVWSAAADVVLEYNPALGDALALATAADAEAALLVGADDDYDGISGVDVVRFRDEPA